MLAMFDNQLLDRLAQSGSSSLADHLEARDFARGDVLAEPHTPIKRLVFPRSGLISIVVETSEGDQIEAGIVGSRGALGLEAVFGAKQNIETMIAQLPSRVWILPVEDGGQLAAFGQFRTLLFAQHQYLLAQAQQTAACNAKHSIAHNAKHSIAQRLCSWLLECAMSLATTSF